MGWIDWPYWARGGVITLTAFIILWLATAVLNILTNAGTCSVIAGSVTPEANSSLAACLDKSLLFWAYIPLKAITIFDSRVFDNLVSAAFAGRQVNVLVLLYSWVIFFVFFLGSVFGRIINNNRNTLKKIDSWTVWWWCASLLLAVFITLFGYVCSATLRGRGFDFAFSCLVYYTPAVIIDGLFVIQAGNRAFFLAFVNVLLLMIIFVGVRSMLAKIRELQKSFTRRSP